MREKKMRKRDEKIERNIKGWEERDTNRGEKGREIRKKSIKGWRENDKRDNKKEKWRKKKKKIVI